MYNPNNSPIAARMDRLVFKICEVDVRVLRRPQANNNLFPPSGLCIASAALVLLTGAGDVRAFEISNIGHSAYRRHLLAAVVSNLGTDNRYEFGGREFECIKLRQAHRALIAQNIYGPGSMDAPPGQPGNMSGPLGFPSQQPGYGPGSMDSPLGQPGNVSGPMDFPAQQPNSMPAPLGIPRTPPGDGVGQNGVPPLQTNPTLPPTEIPSAQPDHGAGATDSLGSGRQTNHSVLRATNTARMRAEALNGGLRVYRTSSCMHQQSGGECLIKNDLNGYLFRFLGGEPGWQQLGKPPSLETEILIGRDGRTVTRLVYNGPPRSVSTPDNRPVSPQRLP